MSKKKRASIEELSTMIKDAQEMHMEIFLSHAVIEGCQGVLEYNSDLIRLDIRSKTVTIRGENLSMGEFYLGQTSIEGNILSIEFSD